MKNAKFRGQITSITPDGGAAFVRLTPAVGKRKFAILNKKVIGTDLHFKVGLVVEGWGRAFPEAIKATTARAVGTASVGKQESAAVAQPQYQPQLEHWAELAD